MPTWPHNASRPKLFTCSLANRISLCIIDSYPVWEIHVTWWQNVLQFHRHLCRVTDSLVTQFENFTCKFAQPKLSNPSCPTAGEGHKGDLKTAKPYRNMLKTRKLHRIFSRIPKPHAHGGSLYELTSNMEFHEVDASLAKMVNHIKLLAGKGCNCKPHT